MQSNSYIVYLFITLLLVSLMISLFSVAFNTSVEIDDAVSNLYSLFEMIVYGLFFHNILTNPNDKKVTVYVFFTLFILNVLNFLLYEGFWVFNSLALTLNSIVYIIFTILYFRQILKNPVTLNLEKYPVFWLAAAIFFYHSASLFIFLFQKFIYLGYFTTSFPIWYIHNFFMILYELIIGYAFLLWIPRKTT
ncbi:MAG: hypothetical protein R2798_03250 [Chitinophagales bacterium]|nr:hypothetical protein [Bacteroidota bacterium]MCB9044335.1 hypothetical protein [Chitinophagales bacterium]